jgi:8-oxo-dGTP diphosphatase
VWRWLPRPLRRIALWCANAHFLVGAVALIHDEEGRVLVARHTYRRHAPWALPGGWVRHGEDPAGAVIREVLEETGLGVTVLGPLAIYLEARGHLTAVFAARISGGTFRPSAEVSEIRFIEHGHWPDGLRRDHRVLIESFRDHPLFKQ